jgi:hypothetical protein
MSSRRHPPQTNASARRYKNDDENNVSLPHEGGRSQEDRERVVDVPVWVEPEGDTCARENPADGVRCLDFEFVFFLSWWVPDRDQEFVVRCRRDGSKRWGNVHFELGLELRWCGRICSKSKVKGPTISRTRLTNHRSASLSTGKRSVVFLYNSSISARPCNQTGGRDRDGLPE